MRARARVSEVSLQVQRSLKVESARTTTYDAARDTTGDAAPDRCERTAQREVVSGASALDAARGEGGGEARETDHSPSCSCRSLRAGARARGPRGGGLRRRAADCPSEGRTSEAREGGGASRGLRRGAGRRGLGCRCCRRRRSSGCRPPANPPARACETPARASNSRARQAGPQRAGQARKRGAHLATTEPTTELERVGGLGEMTWAHCGPIAGEGLCARPARCVRARARGIRASSASPGPEVDASPPLHTNGPVVPQVQATMVEPGGLSLVW
jgi:hypothetical protein